jgi:hypothetical protein
VMSHSQSPIIRNITIHLKKNNLQNYPLKLTSANHIRRTFYCQNNMSMFKCDHGFHEWEVGEEGVGRQKGTVTMKVIPN